jgi:DNA polymerase
MANCSPYLLKQIQSIRPKVICLLGNVAVQGLLQSTRGITSLRGRFTHFLGTPTLPCFHPAYVLRNMSALPTFEADVRLACREAGLAP